MKRAIAFTLFLASCSHTKSNETERADARVAFAPDAASIANPPLILDATASDVKMDDPDSSLFSDDSPLEKNTSDDLIALAGLKPSGFTHAAFAPLPGHFNDGNSAIAHHDISRRACLNGLRDLTIQTPAQRDVCGKDNMVPIYKRGDIRLAKTCIDIFEYPNKPCELPMVWGTPALAESVCQAEGKRLCDQSEWNLACRGDPDGGKDRLYAYGDTLDYDICNTNKPHEVGEMTAWGKQYWKCNVQTADSAWKTCSTDTEPAGAYPRCRSRFGVFDQHGNVAEIMTRKEDGGVDTQLKGSPFFYIDVGHSHDASGAPKMSGGQLHETYPDTCNFDPRWHVESLSSSTHSNYHLGFRCCKSL